MSRHRAAIFVIFQNVVPNGSGGISCTVWGNAQTVSGAGVVLLEKIRARLLKGEWTSGQRMPSIRAMASLQEVSHHAVADAYARLVNEGLLEAQQGRGFFVTSCPPSVQQRAQAGARLPEDPLFRLLQSPVEHVKLGSGWLPPSWLDTEALAKAVRRTARSGQRALVAYGDIQGYLPLRQQLAAHLFRQAKIGLSPEQIITSLGATQALDLVLRLLVSPGDHVLVDEPCNGNLIRLIRLHGGVPLGVPRLKDGPDLSSLDRVLQSCRVRAFVCNSTFHNPTGAGLSPQVAFGVLKRAIEHDFIIVEDDVYGDFLPGGRLNFAQLDDLAHVIHVGSFSKLLSASLRVGYLVCAPKFIEPLIRLKLLTAVAVPGFCERFAHAILADGTYIRHTRMIQRRLLMQQAIARQALGAQGWVFDIEPDGGMFLWARHPGIGDLSAFIAGLEQRGVVLMPGNAFSVSGDHADRTRINVAHLTPDVVQILDEQRRQLA